ncbi:hypothetical protein Ais01nite_02260 [Asanoa ishikariensis]|uniref:Intein C-terminal splicing region/RHS repeat-associated core domain-containing protein n=1 Tax=Asanoa ishikariensis TaxID=137265 RepID=A0A1H3TL24_9ACTN|nr:polymorphic toxin-type HINT domain-containing protein [Asanoa ishikariensis]GIF62191.1 hypothetical protein Ais01nite_02260 [Asanoa ishikariensis]SDZ50983.1 intein C-terminal splicing region/RHS repeat-associated core domain-containing protein [Asanoa ishikariensis]
MSVARSFAVILKRPRIAAVMSAVMIASLLAAPEAAAAPPGGTSSPDISQRSVPTSPHKPAAVSESSMPQWTPSSPKWPAASLQEVDLPAAPAAGARGRLAQAGSGVVSVGRPQVDAAARSAASVPARASVEVFDQKVSKAAALDGVLFRVQRADGGSSSGPVAVDVDTSGFAGAFGGGWRSRLMVARFPACVLTTPAAEGCSSPQPVESSRLDNRTGHVSAVVDAPAVDAPASGSPQQAAPDPAMSAGAQVLAVMAAPSSDTGDFSKTSYKSSYEWTAGTSAGDFSWSYPMAVPPVPGGLQPSVGLSYNSGSVDGQTAGENVQPGAVGEGWDLQTGGYIERAYRPCADDIDHHPSWVAMTGDLCYRFSNFRLVWGGKSTEMIPDANGTWRLADDDGEKLEQLEGASNGATGEHWRLTTADGTKYTFGLNRLPGWSTGKRETHSALNVKVLFNHANEPLYNAAGIRDSFAYVTWRWNLDYVVDVHNNSMAYFYDKQTQRSGTLGHGEWFQTYDRSADLNRIEYGMRAGTELATATPPAKVLFTNNERCLSDCGTFAAPKTANWPDTPWDLDCSTSASACPENLAPSFWTSKKLAKVTTQIWTGTGTTYNSVDEWALTHDFPSTGNGTDPVLWLRSIQRTGRAGGTALTLPEVRFEGVRMDQRADYDPGATMAQPRKFRINEVKTETGGLIGVKYTGVGGGCQFGGTFPTPENNPRRCFPRFFKPQTVEAGFGWWHKYVVESVTEKDLVGGSPDVVNKYAYSLDAASTSVLWAYDGGASMWATAGREGGDEDRYKKSWGDWRGYTNVTITTGPDAGPKTVTKKIFMRGLRGDLTDVGEDRVSTVTNSIGTAWPDNRWRRGWLLEEQHVDSAGQIQSKTIYEPVNFETGIRSLFGWVIPADQRSIISRNLVTRTYTWLAGATPPRFRETAVENTWDPGRGYLLKTNDRGDVALSTDDRCTEYWYTDNTTGGRYLIGMPNRVRTVGVACTATPSFPADAVSDIRTFYDGATTHGAAPTKGLVTKTEAATSYTGSTPNYIKTSTIGYDTTYGRATSVADALDRTGTTTYTQGTNGLDATVKVRNPMPDTNKQEITTTLDPTRGLPITVNDANGKVTTGQYDALGRTTKVWLPGRETNLTPNTEYAYAVTNTAPNSIQTKTLNPAGAQISSFEFFDGLLRPRQTQQMSPDGKTTVSDSKYDERGLVNKISAFYDGNTAPGNALRNFADSNVETQNRYTYDSLGRQSTDELWSLDTRKWLTTATYDGDRVNVDPPVGATPTTTITDARGRASAVWQYAGSGPSGTHEDTSYAYDDSDRLTKVTDAAGNHWDHTYDLLGRRTKTVDPDAGTATSTYNNAGQLITSTDGRGEVLWRKYDELGRQTELRDDSATGTLRASWIYDTLAKGLPTSSTRHTGGNTYTTAVTGYDASYQPLGTTVTVPVSEVGLGSYTTSATYNVDGSIATATLPGGASVGGLPAETLVYEYTAAGAATTMKAGSATTYVGGTTLAWDGQVTQRLLGTGTKQVRQSYVLETGTRRLNTSDVATQNQADTTKWDSKTSTAFKYDDAGNVLSMDGTTNGVLDQIECFKYDHQRRMTNAWTQAATGCTTTPQRTGTDPYQVAWTYDVTGNRKTQATTTAAGTTTATSTYPAAGAPQPHAVSSVAYTGAASRPGDSFGYNGGGFTTSRTVNGTTQTLTWDAEGHLETTTQAGLTTSYVYDADGNRILRRDANGTTLYLGDTEIHRNGTAASDGTRYYSHNGDTVAVRTIAGLTWLSADHHDTNQATINSDTLAMTRRRTMPFGEPRGNQPGTWPGQKGFVGGTLDPTGLTHIDAREYDPTLGRFISVDPLFDLSDPQSWNGYAYANNSPVTSSDPSGLGRIDDGMDSNPVKPPPDPPTPPKGDDGGGTKPSKEDVDKAHDIEDKSTLDVVIEAAGQIVISLLGIDNIMGCIDGSAAACFWAALDVFPVGRAFSLARRSGELISGIARAIKAVGALAKERKWAREVLDAEKAVQKEADDLLGAACKANSFAAGTLVLMADGKTRPIDQIEVGDQLTVTDPESGETTARKVTELHVNIDVALTDLTVTTVNGVETVVKTTDEHPFWVPSRGEWVGAANLHDGVTLDTLDASGAVVRKVTTYSGPVTMYNLTVDNIHTYYVLAGVTPILVHNCPEDLPGDQFSNHARDRLASREVSEAEARRVLDREPFPYWHDGQWKMGYYDPGSKIFIGKTIDGNINTVIRNVDRGYPSRLQRARP